MKSQQVVHVSNKEINFKTQSSSHTEFAANAFMRQNISQKYSRVNTSPHVLHIYDRTLPHLFLHFGLALKLKRRVCVWSSGWRSRGLNVRALSGVLLQRNLTKCPGSEGEREKNPRENNKWKKKKRCYLRATRGKFACYHLQSLRLGQEMLMVVFTAGATVAYFPPSSSLPIPHHFKNTRALGQHRWR